MQGLWSEPSAQTVLFCGLAVGGVCLILLYIAVYNWTRRGAETERILAETARILSETNTLVRQQSQLVYAHQDVLSNHERRLQGLGTAGIIVRPMADIMQDIGPRPGHPEPGSPP